MEIMMDIHMEFYDKTGVGMMNRIKYKKKSSFDKEMIKINVAVLYEILYIIGHIILAQNAMDSINRIIVNEMIHENNDHLCVVL